MAGLGKKTWSPLDVLTAADMNGYLMDQSVMKFASAAARSSAIGTGVSAGMVSFRSDGTVWEGYNGTSWGPLSASATITANRAAISDGSGNITASTATATEVSYLSGVTSAIQTQLNAKVSTTNGSVTTAATGSTVVRNITLSTSDPTGGSDGDVWLKYTA